MKKISLLRHAKSDHSGDLDDHERPLNPRGKKACVAIGAYMRDQDILPDYILCSTATRTRETIDGFLTAAKALIEVTYEHGLYLATPGEMLKLANQTASEVQHLMLVGHNPGIHQLATLLTLDGDPEFIRLVHTQFPTAALATFDLDITDWQQLEPAIGTLVDFQLPRML